MPLLLINLPGTSVRMPEEHCGLAILKAVAETKDVHTDILDAYAMRLSLEDCLIAVGKWLKERQLDEQLYIGIAPFVTSYESFLAVGRFIKEHRVDCLVFAGGHFATLNRNYLLEHCSWLDAIIVGEGDLTLIEMLTAKSSGEIPGVCWHGKEHKFIPRRRITDLDNLPFQARYLTLAELRGQPFAITTSRGCYGDCSFCSISRFYKENGLVKQTCRSAASVSEEIHQLVKNYGISALKIVDDNFFRADADAFLDELTERIADLHLSFRLSARPNDITPYRAKKLREMGAVVVAIGAESASAESLRFFNKGIGLDCSERAIAYLTENGITCLVNFIMFDPIIDFDGLKQNYRFVAKYADSALFHRINSHLWLRSTDPIAMSLEKMGLCQRQGFPYLSYNYKHKDVENIFNKFDKWCRGGMEEYYRVADILMAGGIHGNLQIYKQYRELLYRDLAVLQEMLFE